MTNPELGDEMLDLKVVRVMVDVDAAGDAARLCLTTSNDVLLIAANNPIVLTRLTNDLDGVMFEPGSDGRGGMFVVDDIELQVADAYPPAKLDYALRCFADARIDAKSKVVSELGALPTSPGWYADPSRKHSQRYFSASMQWERLCRDANLREVTDYDTDLVILNGRAEPPAPRLKRNATAVDFAPGVEIPGSNGSVRIDGRFVVLTRGLSHDLFLGNLRGSKSIPVKSIQAVQLKRATRFVGGALEFVVAGDKSNTGHDRMGIGNSEILTAVVGRQLARASNENIITFNLIQQPALIALHEHVLELIDAPTLMTLSAPTAPAVQPDFVEQLERLRALHADGVLSDGEFTAAKARLIG